MDSSWALLSVFLRLFVVGLIVFLLLDFLAEWLAKLPWRPMGLAWLVRFSARCSRRRLLNPAGWLVFMACFGEAAYQVLHLKEPFAFRIGFGLFDYMAASLWLIARMDQERYERELAAAKRTTTEG